MFVYNLIQLLLHNARTSLVAMIMVLAATAVIPSVAQANTTACGPVEARIAVVVVHGGGWVGGSPAYTQHVCQLLGNMGYRAFNISYPLYDLDAATITVIQTARFLRSYYGQVYAYGESAGATMVATAAALGVVDWAYAWAPVSDLVRWSTREVGRYWPWDQFNGWSNGLGWRLKMLWRNSPLAYASADSSPILVEHGYDDNVVPISHSLRLAKKWPAMKLRIAHGGHMRRANAKNNNPSPARVQKQFRNKSR